MKNVFALCTCFILVGFVAKSQFNTIEKIRAYYTTINGKVANALKDKVGMYCNEVVVNKTRASWPASGNYQMRITLWYSDDPVSHEAERPAEYLEKVNISGEIASQKYTQEYLFYKGEMLFYCFFNSYKDNDIYQRDEHRLYFNNKKLLKYDLKQGSRKVLAETQVDIQKEAIRQSKILKQLFLNSCGFDADRN